MLAFILLTIFVVCCYSTSVALQNVDIGIFATNSSCKISTKQEYQFYFNRKYQSIGIPIINAKDVENYHVTSNQARITDVSLQIGNTIDFIWIKFDPFSGAANFTLHATISGLITSLYSSSVSQLQYFFKWPTSIQRLQIFFSVPLLRSANPPQFLTSNSSSSALFIVRPTNPQQLYHFTVSIPALNCKAPFFLFENTALLIIIVSFIIGFVCCSACMLLAIRILRAAKNQELAEQGYDYSALLQEDHLAAPVLKQTSRIVYPSPLPKFFKVMPKIEVACANFSWMAYADTGYVNTEISDETGFPKLEGLGLWILVNEINYELRNFTVHVSVFQNHTQGVVVFACRGATFHADSFATEQATQEWLCANFDLHVSMYRNKDVSYGKVHSIALSKYNCVKDIIRNQVRLFGDAKYQIVFTGFDQGAAVASLATLDCIEQYPELTYRISLVTFGLYKFCSTEFCNYFRTVVPTDRVSHYITCYPSSSQEIRDVVTLLPTGKRNGMQNLPGSFYFVRANTNYVGNSANMKNVPSQYFAVKPELPLSFAIHSVQCYVDGLLFEDVSKEPFQSIGNLGDTHLVIHKKWLAILEAKSKNQEPSI